MGLDDALCDQPPLTALRALLVRWFGFDVGPIDASCDERGVPNALHEIARLARDHPGSISPNWQRAGTIRDDGEIRLERAPADGTWCTPGSVEQPVFARRPMKTGIVQRSAHLDEYLLSSFIAAARLAAPVRVHTTTDTLEDAHRFLAPYRKIIGGGDMQGEGTYAGPEVLILLLPPMGTLWPKARLFLQGHTRRAVEAAITGDLRGVSWRRLDGIYEPETDHVLSRRAGPPPAKAARYSGMAFDEALAARGPDRALDRFLQAWHGVELPSASADDILPPLLAAVHQLTSVYPIVERNPGLLPAEEVASAAGPHVRFYCSEGDTVASFDRRVGHLPVTVLPAGPSPTPTIETTLDEFLLSLVVNFAIDRAPFHARTESWVPADAERAMADFRLVRRTSPRSAIHATATAVALVTHHPGAFTVKVAARSRDSIARTSLRTLGGWQWFHRLAIPSAS